MGSLTVKAIEDEHNAIRGLLTSVVTRFGEPLGKVTWAVRPSEGLTEVLVFFNVDSASRDRLHQVAESLFVEEGLMPVVSDNRKWWRRGRLAITLIDPKKEEEAS